jgi:hypothetical protein
MDQYLLVTPEQFDIADVCVIVYGSGRVHQRLQRDAVGLGWYCYALGCSAWRAAQLSCCAWVVAFCYRTGWAVLQ